MPDLVGHDKQIKYNKLHVSHFQFSRYNPHNLTMYVTVHTAKNKTVDKLDAKSVYLPGANGDMQILENHIPVLAALKTGNIIIERKSGGKINIALDTGFVQFSDNNMVILIEKTSLSPEELKEIESKAKQMKDTEIGLDEEDITETEFEHSEQSKH
jgi:F-type H+-transporting ATPase subunit epsilon